MKKMIGNIYKKIHTIKNIIILYMDLQEKLLSKNFIITFLAIFIILYVAISLIKFIGNIPILLIISFLITYYVQRNN